MVEYVRGLRVNTFFLFTVLVPTKAKRKRGEQERLQARNEGWNIPGRRGVKERDLQIIGAGHSRGVEVYEWRVRGGGRIHCPCYKVFKSKGITTTFHETGNGNKTQEMKSSPMRF